MKKINQKVKRLKGKNLETRLSTVKRNEKGQFVVGTLFVPRKLELSERKGGMPTKKTELIIQALEDIFKVGGDYKEACSHAGIGHRTYYRWLKKDDHFAWRMTTAQQYSDLVAKKVVVSRIEEGDGYNSRWWLEKRQFKDQPQQSTTQINQFNFGDASVELHNKFLKFLKNETLTVQ